MQIVSASPAAVKVQAGASMEALLTFLEQGGYGLTATPAPGDLTVGGALAIDAHGTAIPALGETRTPGHTYGSLSNLIVSLTAVTWNEMQSSYELRIFDRSDPDCKAFLTHLGRAFLAEVTDHPEWDVAVWFDNLTFPGTPDANQFFAELESWMFSNYAGSYATVRPEWSKGWGYTNDGAWTSPTILTSTIPAAFRAGPGPGWDWAIATLDHYDPNRIFSNTFLDELLV